MPATVGRNSVVGIATRYELDGPEIESTPVQTGHGAYPASYTLDNGSPSRG